MFITGLLKSSLLLLILLAISPACIQEIRKQYTHYFVPHSSVGIMRITKPLETSLSYAQDLQSFFEDKEIKAILLILDISHGSLSAGQSLHNEITALKQKYHKPVVVLVENYCTGPGYYCACAADTIIAPGAAIIGGITKDSGELSKYQMPALANDIYQQFITDVAKSRTLSLSQSSVWANGSLFTAQQAAEVGLIDRIGSFSTALALIKEKALIDGPIEWVHPTPGTIIERINSFFCQCKA